jgi:hypothetical protein
MKPGFDHQLLKDDLTMAKDAVFGFFKSFGPAPRQFGFGEDMKTRFMLSLVEMGPLKVIKTVMVTIVALILLLVVFIHADVFFKLISAAALVVFYAWMFSGEILDAVTKETASLPQKGLAALNFALKFVEPPKPK